MRTFKDLQFEPRPTPVGDGIRAVMKFQNGYGISVAQTPYTYGGKQGLYEAAVLDINGEVCYDTPITDDVIGYLRPEDVTDVMAKVQELPNMDTDPRLFQDGYLA